MISTVHIRCVICLAFLPNDREDEAYCHTCYFSACITVGGSASHPLTERQWRQELSLELMARTLDAEMRRRVREE